MSLAITRLLARVRQGDDEARSALYDAIYSQLEGQARAYLRRQRPDHTLDPSALVGEAYLKLVQQQGEFHDRGHFFAQAARAMRWVLVDHARAKQRLKRHGEGHEVPLELISAHFGRTAFEVLDLHEALADLEARDPQAAQVVELRFFGGLSVPETAEVLDVSTRTVERDWTFARAWLRSAME